MLRRSFESWFVEHGGAFDAVVLPTTPFAAPRIGGLDAVTTAPLLTRLTAPFNLTGLPALSVPCGVTSEGLPIGLQIVGAPWAERRVLRAGRAYEEAASRSSWPRSTDDTLATTPNDPATLAGRHGNRGAPA